MAGVHTAQSLVRIAQEHGAKQDSDFPEFFLYNLPFKGTDERGVVDEPKVCNQLRFALYALNDLRCDYALISCNTFHFFLPFIEDVFQGKFINMVDVACDAAMGCDEVGILCSHTSKRLLLYETALNHRRIRPVVTTDQEQAFLDKAIGEAICGDRPEKNWKGIHCLIDNLRQRGAQRVIGGCTEIPLTLNGHHPSRDSFLDAGELAVREAFRLLTGGAP